MPYFNNNNNNNNNNAVFQNSKNDGLPAEVHGDESSVFVGRHTCAAVEGVGKQPPTSSRW